MEKTNWASEDVRYLTSTMLSPGWTVAATRQACCPPPAPYDRSPVIYLPPNAYGLVTALKGAYAVTPMVVKPKPSDSDPGSAAMVGWKTMQGAVILNDAWMIRAEVAGTA